MPLKKLVQKAGVNRENTRYTNENGYYESEKVRFRQGTPEKIGGWIRISASTFLGVCRSLWNWITLGGLNLLGIGTNLKFYIESGGFYNDITGEDAAGLVVVGGADGVEDESGFLLLFQCQNVGHGREGGGFAGFLDRDDLADSIRGGLVKFVYRKDVGAFSAVINLDRL
jgi:hypothetical protein